MDSNAQQRDHETSLHFVCFRGKPEIARLLLDCGAQVNTQNDQGETPLHLVSRGEYSSLDDGVRVAELLLERGTDTNAQDKFGWTPLHSASYNGMHEITQVLLRHGAKVNLENHLGETALHLSREGKYGSRDGVRVAQLLLDAGLDVNARDKRNWTPLHAASYYGRVKIAQLLLDRGAITAAVDGQGKTPLHQVSQGSFESLEAGCRIAELLLERGVDPNTQDNNLETPLHVASRRGRSEIVQALLVHITVKNARRTISSLLGSGGMYYCEKKFRLTHSFLGFSVNVNALSKNNWTPLHLACSWGRFETAQLLLDNGANTILKTDSGETALHTVANGKHESIEEGVRVAQLLLERGADVNVRSKTQWTPLHCCIPQWEA
jgi:ankyrin